MRVAVTGSTGCLGRALLQQLLPGSKVKALFRHPGRLSEHWARQGCQVVVGDLEDETALATLVQDAQIVYHCAAAMGKSDPALSHRVNVLGTERLARVACGQQVTRFVYVSSISVYAATRRADHNITEEVEPEHVNRLNSYGFTKYRGEQIVREYGTRGLPYTIVRPTNVYGPWSRPWFLQWERTLKWNPFAIGRIPIDVVYVDDVVTALRQAAVSPAASNETFHLGHEMLMLSEFIARVGAVVGRETWPLPRVLDSLLRAGIERTYQLVTGKCMSMSLLQPVVYPHTKASLCFGYSPQYRLDVGFAALGEWYRRESTAPRVAT